MMGGGFDNIDFPFSNQLIRTGASLEEADFEVRTKLHNQAGVSTQRPGQEAVT